MSFVTPESLAEQIAGHLAERIIQGDLKSNERIQEGRVVQELEVSRGPVREALLLLESRHLVTILPRRGAIVTELTPHRVRSLYDMYVTLLTMLADLLARNWNDNNKQVLLDQAMRLQELASSQDKNAFILAGFELMRKAFTIANNDYLAQMLEDLQPAIHRTYAMSIRHSPDETELSRQFFSGLVTAVLSRDTDTLPKIFHSYGRHQCSLVLAAMQEDN
jgi:DNA-binding GntR family transcriptional regulator